MEFTRFDLQQMIRNTEFSDGLSTEDTLLTAFENGDLETCFRIFVEGYEDISDLRLANEDLEDENEVLKEDKHDLMEERDELKEENESLTAEMMKYEDMSLSEFKKLHPNAELLDDLKDNDNND